MINSKMAKLARRAAGYGPGSPVEYQGRWVPAGRETRKRVIGLDAHGTPQFATRSLQVRVKAGTPRATYHELKRGMQHVPAY